MTPWLKQDAAPPSCHLPIPPPLPFQVLLTSFHSPHLHPARAPAACPLTCPSFSFSAPLPLGGLSVFSHSLNCGLPLFTGQASLSHCSLSASRPTRSSRQGLSSTGAQHLHSASFVLGPETKGPRGPEPNRDGHECCSGPSPALFPWPHIVLVHQSPGLSLPQQPRPNPISTHSRGRTRTNKQN